MIRIGAALLAAAFFCVPAFSQELSEEQQGEADRFALNNSLFVLQHEIGHLFVAEFGLPVLGKEEDAADILASLLFLWQETEEADQTLIDAADGWYLTDQSRGEDAAFEGADFYDEHSLDLQRSYQIVCLMVGAAPDVFGEVATEYEIDEERQETCSTDYDQSASSWDAVLAEHRAEEGKAGETITVRYEDPDGAHEGVAELLKGSQFLETAAENVSTGYVLPRPLTFRATMCDEPNAFYDYDEAEVVFCYEMTQLYLDLIGPELLASPE
jgi:hypothetical protein